MEDELLEVYREIADTLDALIPVQWQVIHVYAEMNETDVQFDVAILPNRSESLEFGDMHAEWQATDNDMHEWEDLRHYVVELQTIFARYNQALFTSFYYYLAHTGELGIVFTTDSFDQVADTFKTRFVKAIAEFDGIA